MGGHHCHHHEHAKVTGATFALGVALNTAFVLIEGGFGLYYSSLALVADAGHNLSDVLGLLLAWGASYLSRQRPSARRTYGLGRSSILAALANGVLLLVAVGMIAWEALARLTEPQAVPAGIVMAVAGIGAVVNTLTAMLFFSGRNHDLNVRGAFLHMAADAAISVGVVIGGFLMSRTGIDWIDPLLALVIAAAIAYSTWDLLWQAIELSLDSVPRGIDPEAVRGWLAGLEGVTQVHDLHIWALSTTESALTAHLIRPHASLDDDWLHSVACELHDRFGISHTTIQIETGQGAAHCRLAPDDVI